LEVLEEYGLCNTELRFCSISACTTDCPAEGEIGGGETLLKERFAQLGRLTRPSTWRFIALICTDPRWHYLFDSLSARNIKFGFEAPVPWVAWHALPILETEVRAREGQRVLEWGVGASTLWYQNHGLHVTGIEHDPAWFAACRERLGDAVDLRLLPLGSEYSRPDIDLSEFGIIVVDGRTRNACAEFVIEGIRDGRVSTGTLILFDDTNRERYSESVEELFSLCSDHRSYSGPTSVEIDKLTTLFWV
jgi:hypothetical protein